MRLIHDASSAASGQPVRGRLAAALLMGLILLILAAMTDAAAAPRLGQGWASLGAIWLAALAATVLAVHQARSGIAAWRRMCLLNAIASLGLLSASAANLAGPRVPPDMLWPRGPVLGFSIASALLTIAGLLLAALFFAVWYLLSRHDRESAGQA